MGMDINVFFNDAPGITPAVQEVSLLRLFTLGNGLAILEVIYILRCIEVHELDPKREGMQPICDPDAFYRLGDYIN